MKKLLILMSLALIVPQLYAKSPADDFIAFKNLESSHKSEWFDHMKRSHDVKYDLLKKHHQEWVSYSNKNAIDWQNNSDCSQDKKDKIFADHLNGAAHLHKRQSSEIEKLCKELNEEALNIQKRHEQELNIFFFKVTPYKPNRHVSDVQKQREIIYEPMHEDTGSITE